MTEVGLISGEILSIPEGDTPTVLKLITESRGQFANLPIHGRANWIRVAHVVYVRDSETPEAEEIPRSLSDLDPVQERFRP